MITDIQTNTLYLADCLPKQHPTFFANFESVLRSCDISIHLLPDTKDIWVADYMPIQISLSNFIQFVYNPDNLQSKKWLKSEIDAVRNAIAHPRSNGIVEGNVNRLKTKKREMYGRAGFQLLRRKVVFSKTG
ncbi:MAG: transposase [Prevotella sp.]|nr:transposase [Prevotella sp.]